MKKLVGALVFGVILLCITNINDFHAIDVSLDRIISAANADEESGGGSCDFIYYRYTIYYSECTYETCTTFQCIGGTGNVCFEGHSIIYYEGCEVVDDYDGVSTRTC